MITIKGLIGVIVPVYKVEKYIAECIESILAQTYTNFRLILVDDGSPDNAGIICDEYAKKDSRITVIHQENGGVTSARARGVEEADDCEFITFVDADDTIPQNSLQELYDSIQSHPKPIDIIIGNRIDRVDSIDEIYYNKIGNGLYNSTEYINALLVDDCIIGPISKLIRRSIFSPKVFELDREVVQFEDLYMNIILAKRATNILINNDIDAYIHRADSTTSQYFRNGYMKENGWFILLLSLKEFFIKENILEGVSKNFSRFAYIRICGCMNFNKCRFKSCEQLQIKTYNKMQESVMKANRSALSYFLYTIKRKIKTLFKK